ncbi:MAG: sensor histidine kinase, partial [Syntrophomonadaceae bacterium]|nr:sensor histidine kinase [Syntrophomonadaceae bacterium]
MNDHTSDNTRNRFSDKIKFSIVWKLNLKLFFRILGIFLALDIMLILLLLSGLIIRAEQTAAMTVDMLNQTGLPSPEAESWLKITEYSISQKTESANEFQIPENLQKFFP